MTGREPFFNGWNVTIGGLLLLIAGLCTVGVLMDVVNR